MIGVLGYEIISIFGRVEDFLSFSNRIFEIIRIMDYLNNNNNNNYWLSILYFFAFGCN